MKDEIAKNIKETIQRIGTCPFIGDNDSIRYHCRLVNDPLCGYFGTLIGFDKQTKKEYYMCRLYVENLDSTRFCFEDAEKRFHSCWRAEG